MGGRGDAGEGGVGAPSEWSRITKSPITGVLHGHQGRELLFDIKADAMAMGKDGHGPGMLPRNRRAERMCPDLHREALALRLGSHGAHFPVRGRCCVGCDQRTNRNHTPLVRARRRAKTYPFDNPRGIPGKSPPTK